MPPEVRLGTREEAGLVIPGSLNEPAMLPLTWPDIAWLRSITQMPIVLKGIMTGEDAALAVEHGVDAIVVSNHGGRQVDGTLATIEILPEIAQRVGGRIEILLDGGIRRGTDVLKALALGAKAVLIARPYLWGLAANGEEGVRRVLEMLRDEIDCAMAQLGRPDIRSIDSTMVDLR
jgi:isopentenyl diphosphate isomerase/L-lactate dehydrogenase-like FMN-dependent dehydrogenase